MHLYSCRFESTRKAFVTTIIIHYKTNVMFTLRNTVQLIGHLADHPEVKQTENGKTMARFRIGTKENFRDANGEKTSETQWHRLVAWGKTAEIIQQYLKKGSHVAVDGKLVHRQYTDKVGLKRYVTEIQVNEMMMLDHKVAAVPE
jgi:single-strand DNA-binding protein